MSAADEAELVHMVATAVALDDRPSALRYPRGDGVGVDMPEVGVPLEIGKGRIVREGGKVALLSLGTRLAECRKAADDLAAFGLPTTVADARFAKPLDVDLILRLAREHEVLITVEEGSIGGFGSQVLHLLAEQGMLRERAEGPRHGPPRRLLRPRQPDGDVRPGRSRFSGNCRQGVRHPWRQRSRRNRQTRAIMTKHYPPNGKAPIQVVLAQPRGFCAGVVRAIEIVDRALQKYGAPVYVRHEIVHNKHVVESLKAKGARFVESVAEIPDGAVTIFSAHGVAHRVEQEATERGLPVLDATCPLVTKVHNQGKRYVGQGRTLILIGHAGHPEVEGTIGQISVPVVLVQTEEDVNSLDIPADVPVAYVTQTTLSVDDTKGIIEALKRRFSDIVGPETKDICYATQNRQTAVRELSKLVDVILVVGAKNSSNSNRLREIGAEAGIPSYLIADGSELKPEWVQEARVVGITAGASAPEVLIDDVIEGLRRVAPVEISTLPGREETIEFRLPTELTSG